MHTVTWLLPYLVRALLMVGAALLKDSPEVSGGLMALSVAIPSQGPQPK